MKFFTIILAFLVSTTIFASNYNTVLISLEKKIEVVKQNGVMPVIVFDIDNTIISSSPRIEKILKDANKKYHSKSLAKYLKNKNNEFKYHQLKELFVTLKVKPKKSEKIFKYFNEKFFLNEYTKYDVALKNSLEMVNKFYKKGAFIIYLTARGRKALVGTIDSLDRLGFPIAKTRTSLIMRDSREQKSPLYKKRALAELSTMGTILAVFDDKIENLEAFTSFFNDQFSLYLVNSSSKNKKMTNITLK